MAPRKGGLLPHPISPLCRDLTSPVSSPFCLCVSITGVTRHLQMAKPVVTPILIGPDLSSASDHFLFQTHFSLGVSPSFPAPPPNLLESSFPNPVLSTSPCPRLKCCGPQRVLYDRPVICELDNQESTASAALSDLLHNPLISALLSKPIPEFWPSLPAWTSSRASSRVSLPLVLPALVHCPQCS